MTPPKGQLPPLRHVTLSSLENPKNEAQGLPRTRIKFDQDVEVWKRTRGYQDYGLFLRRLSDAVEGKSLPWDEADPPSQSVNGIVGMLDELDRWIDDIPPQPTPQRFGNLAFRVWGKRLEDRAHSLLSSLLPESHRASVPYLEPYLTTSFGSFVRMDYGTGHETSFALLLLSLTLIRFLHPDPEEERHIVSTVFMRYLTLCWRLQDVYRLEPAGSHGVWGLDDYHFLPFIFGSSQLKGGDVTVDAILRPPLPPTNMYFMSIMRIHQVKTGPFHEHSSQLHAIATGVAHWAKVNSGLFKMYEAEVLGKRVVVQHIPLGGLLEWDVSEPDAVTESGSPLSTSSYPSVRAPWAQTTPQPQGVTRAPWA